MNRRILPTLRGNPDLRGISGDPLAPGDLSHHAIGLTLMSRGGFPAARSHWFLVCCTFVILGIPARAAQQPGGSTVSDLESPFTTQPAGPTSMTTTPLPALRPRWQPRDEPAAARVSLWQRWSGRRKSAQDSPPQARSVGLQQPAPDRSTASVPPRRATVRRGCCRADRFSR